jgi:hypothetical protein
MVPWPRAPLGTTVGLVSFISSPLLGPETKGKVTPICPVCRSRAAAERPAACGFCTIRSRELPAWLAS